MRPLRRLIGTWLTEGVTLRQGEPTGERFVFVDHYAWLAGGHFIAHTVTGELDGVALHGLEIIGYDGKVLCATSYDSQGVVTHYRARLTGRMWSMVSPRERFNGSFSPDGKRLAGEWERKTARGEWRATMRVTLTRISM